MELYSILGGFGKQDGKLAIAVVLLPPQIPMVLLFGKPLQTVSVNLT